MYQGTRSGDKRAQVDALHDLMIGCEPDVTFLIDMDPDLGHARAKGRGGTEERFEDFGAELQHKMRAGFLQLAQDHPDRFRVIDGTRDIDTVAADVLATALADIKARA